MDQSAAADALSTARLPGETIARGILREFANRSRGGEAGPAGGVECDRATRSASTEASGYLDGPALWAARVASEVLSSDPFLARTVLVSSDVIHPLFAGAFFGEVLEIDGICGGVYRLLQSGPGIAEL